MQTTELGNIQSQVGVSGLAAIQTDISLTNSAVRAYPLSVIANGAQSATVQVTLRDSAGVTLHGKTISLTSSRGALDTITIEGVGVFSVKSRISGESVFTASVTAENVELSGSTIVTFIAGPTNRAISTVAAASADGIAGAVIPVSVVLKDTYGNGIAGKTVSLTSSRAGDTITPQSAISDDTGSVSFSVSSTLTGSSVYRATDVSSGILLASSATVAWSAAPLSLAQSTLVLSSNTIVSNSAATLTFTLRDAYGNPILDSSQSGNLSVAVLSEGVSSGIVGAFSALGGSPGVYQASLTGTIAGTSNRLKGVFSSSDLTSARPSFTVTPGPPFSIAVSSGNGLSGTVETALAPMIARVQDFYNNNVPSVTVNWAATAGGGGLSSASSLTGATGLAASTLTLGPIPALNTVRATVNGTALFVDFSATGSWDADASNYFSRVTNTNLGVDPILLAEKQNIGRFIVGLKNAGLWTVLGEMWMMRQTQNIGSGVKVAALKSAANDGTLINGPTWANSGLNFYGIGVIKEMRTSYVIPPTAGTFMNFHRFNLAPADNQSIFTGGVNVNGRQFYFGKAASPSYIVGTAAGLWPKNVNSNTNLATLSAGAFALMTISQQSSNTAKYSKNKALFVSLPYLGNGGALWSDLPANGTLGLWARCDVTGTPDTDFSAQLYFLDELSDAERDTVYDLYKSNLGQGLGLP